MGAEAGEFAATAPRFTTGFGDVYVNRAAVGGSATHFSRIRAASIAPA